MIKSPNYNTIYTTFLRPEKLPNYLIHSIGQQTIIHKSNSLTYHENDLKSPQKDNGILWNPEICASEALQRFRPTMQVARILVLLTLNGWIVSFHSTKHKLVPQKGLMSFYTYNFIVSMYTEREDDGSSRFFLALFMCPIFTFRGGCYSFRTETSVRILILAVEFKLIMYNWFVSNVLSFLRYSAKSIANRFFWIKIGFICICRYEKFDS